MKIIQPDLFIPGAAKSGTTSLHELLDLHPDICMSLRKEPTLWNSDKYEDPEQLSWYNSQFPQPHSKIKGESSTAYMFFPKFKENISRQFEKEPKFIFILRNPIDRCYSHYWWMKGLGYEKRDFKTAVEEDMKREFEEYDYYPNFYFHFGLYGKWLELFYQEFDRKNIKIILFEDLVTNRLVTLNSCFQFLEVDPLEDLPEIKANETVSLRFPKIHNFLKSAAAGRYKFTKIAKYVMPKSLVEQIRRKLASDTVFSKSAKLEYPELDIREREWLKSVYQEDTKKLKDLTGLSFNSWTDFKE